MTETIWVRNKNTGMVWEVGGEHAAYLLSQPNVYEQVEDPTKPKREEQDGEPAVPADQRSRRRSRGGSFL